MLLTPHSPVPGEAVGAAAHHVSSISAEDLTLIYCKGDPGEEGNKMKLNPSFQKANGKKLVAMQLWQISNYNTQSVAHSRVPDTLYHSPWLSAKHK